MDQLLNNGNVSFYLKCCWKDLNKKWKFPKIEWYLRGCQLNFAHDYIYAILLSMHRYYYVISISLLIVLGLSLFIYIHLATFDHPLYQWDFNSQIYFLPIIKVHIHAAMTNCTCFVYSGNTISKLKILGGDSNVCYILGHKWYL
jgi:hypothetical protein